jgi:hypothetical protein
MAAGRLLFLQKLLLCLKFLLDFTHLPTIARHLCLSFKPHSVRRLALGSSLFEQVAQLVKAEFFMDFVIISCYFHY